MPKKRVPYIAVELDLIGRVPALAAAARRSEAEVGWGLVRLWQYCWQARSPWAHRLVVEGFLPGALEALLAFGLVRADDAGVLVDHLRVSGLDRYLRVSLAQSEAARAVNVKRGVSGTVSGAVSAPVSVPEGAVSAPLSGGGSAGKIEDRRSKIEIRSKDLRPDDQQKGQQEAFSPIPLPHPDRPKKQARKPSAWEALWADLHTDRAVKLAADAGLAPEEALLDGGDGYEVPAAQVNSLLRKVAGDLAPGAAREEQEAAVREAWGAFLDSTFGAGTTPPYALTAFASPKVSRPNLERARGGR